MVVNVGLGDPNRSIELDELFRQFELIGPHAVTDHQDDVLDSAWHREFLARLIRLAVFRLVSRSVGGSHRASEREGTNE
jgi:hypothetical protein